MLERGFLGLLGVVFLGTPGCRSEFRDLGDPCVLSDEQQPQFSGLAVGDVVVETGAPGCDSGVCLAHGFQGRASCPYGQSAGAGECLTPSGEVVEVAVEPQLLRRPPSDTMICSCRCAGPGPGPFCECGDGMGCVPLLPAIGIRDESAGSYCVRDGTDFSNSTYSRELCSAGVENCEDRTSSVGE